MTTGAVFGLLAVAHVVAVGLVTTGASSEGQGPPPPVRITGVPLPNLCGSVHDLPASTTLVMSSNAQFDPEYVFVVQGTEFSVGVREEDSRVVYIATGSADFKTPEGLTTASSLAETRAFATDELRMEPGWGYYLPLRSGWSAAFFVGDSGTESIPIEESSVRWFFKRRRDCQKEPASN